MPAASISVSQPTSAPLAKLSAGGAGVVDCFLQVVAMQQTITNAIIILLINQSGILFILVVIPIDLCHKLTMAGKQMQIMLIHFLPTLIL